LEAYMKKILGTAIAAGMLAGAGAANATIVTGYSAPFNSEAVFVAWDDVAKKSVIVDTGVHFNDIFNAVNDGNPATNFSANVNVTNALTAAFGADLSHVQWNVAQFSRQGATVNPTLGWSHQGTMVTTALDDATPGSLDAVAVSMNITAYRTYFNATVDTSNGTSATESVNNFYATADDTSSIYAGGDEWSYRMRNSVPFDTTIVGSGELNYYFLGLNTTGDGVNMYKVGDWALNLATGGLTFATPTASEVPVPAAAWLLVSGLAGLGTVARRRKQA